LCRSQQQKCNGKHAKSTEMGRPTLPVDAKG
jgi:hypothetical protein